VVYWPVRIYDLGTAEGGKQRESCGESNREVTVTPAHVTETPYLILGSHVTVSCAMFSDNTVFTIFQKVMQRRSNA